MNRTQTHQHAVVYNIVSYNAWMYIIAIAWLYVAFMMAITAKSVIGGISTFLFYGLLPCALFMYIIGGPGRAKRRRQAERERWMAEQAQMQERTEVSEPEQTESKPPNV